MNDGEAADRPRPAVATLPNGGLLLDVGQQSDHEINGLKQGRGELARCVEAAVSGSRAELGIGAAREIVPIVLLYREAEPDYVVIVPQSPSAP